MADMIRAREQRSEHVAVRDNAPDRNAAEADTVITPLAADQANALASSRGAVIIQRDLERGIHRFRTGICEEHPTEALWRDGREAAGKLKSLWMADIENRRVVEFGDLV